MYKAILFDLDGTLVDTDMMLIKVFLDLYDIYSPGKKLSVARVTSFSGPSLKDTLPVEFPNVPYDQVYHDFEVLSFHYYAETAFVYDGCLEVLRRLKELGIRLAVVTNKAHDASLVAFKSVGLPSELFDVIVGGDDMIAPKPSPDGIFKAMKALKVDNVADVLYVGDTIYDYRTAVNSGVDLMMVTWTPRPLQPEIKARYYIASYADFLKEINLK